MKKKILYILIALFAALCLISPNPFGNNPDAVYDESYFLNTALGALQHKLPPGLYFSSGGAYYGGVQTNLLTLALVPTLGIIRLGEGSTNAAAIVIAAHIGDLTQLTRILNGLAVLLVGFLFAKNIRTQSSRSKKISLLFALLLAGNSLFMTGVHTGKVWIIELCIEVSLALIVIFWEERTKDAPPTLLQQQRYLDALIFLPILASLQAITGIITFLWVGYALLLKHVTLSQLLHHLKKRFPWIVLLVALNISFIVNGWREYHRLGSSATNLTASQFRTTNGEVDYVKRFVWPFWVLLQSQPIALLSYFLGIITTFFFVPTDTKRNRWTWIILIHPLIIYAYYHLFLGFGLFPRYVLPFSIFLSLSAAVLLSRLRKAWTGTVLLAGLLGLAVCMQTTRLFWSPSSEKQLTEYIEHTLNRESVTLVVQSEQLTPPLNTRSLAALNTVRKNFQRYAFLRSQPDLASAQTSLASLVLFATPADPPLTLASTTTEIYTIDNDCSRPCDQNAVSCVSFNQNACVIVDAYPQELTTLPELFKSTQLGRPYFLRYNTSYPTN